MNGNGTLLSPDEFTQAAAQQLAAAPEVEILGVDELRLELRVRGRSVTTELHNFYTLYRQAPSELAAVWAALSDGLLTLAPDRSEDDPAVLLDRVFPMLKPLTLLNTVREQNLPLLAYRPFVGELMIAYVIDEGQSVAFVNEQHLAHWKIRESQLHRRALANLRDKDWQPSPGILGTGASGLLIFSTRDGFDATRVVLPELFAPFAAAVPGNVIIGTPNRDFLIAFSDADAEIFSRVRMQIEVDARTQPHALSAQLMTLRNGQIQLYDPNA
jgi:uncharacterized protein YtpQ (UPF0354 family)